MMFKLGLKLIENYVTLLRDLCVAILIFNSHMAIQISFMRKYDLVTKTD